MLALASALTAAIVLWPSRTAEEETREGSGAADAGQVVAEVISSVAAQVPGVGGQFGAAGLRGRLGIWEESWGLMTSRPWFGFDNLSFPFVRPLVGYGPDFFHSTYLLVSPPGFNKLPSEFVHAHNYFVHQGVELGFLGLIASLSLFAAPILVGGYQLVWRRKGYGILQRLLLFGVLAIVLGRLLEQLVGIARVSDLTVFWVLLGVFAALPTIMDEGHVAPDPAPLPRGRRRRRSNRQAPGTGPEEASRPWRFYGQLAFIGFLIIGIGVLTWMKDVNYLRAALIADQAHEQLRAGDPQAALLTLDRSIDLAPDVSSYYSNRTGIYSRIRQSGSLSHHSKCGGLAEPLARNVCLTEEEHLGNLKWEKNRPLSFQSRFALANSFLSLASLENDPQLASESVRLYRETAEMVPTSYAAWNRLADVYIILGQPREALGPLENALALLGDDSESRRTLLLQAEAYQNLGEFQQELESLDRVIRILPSDDELYYIRGSTYRMLGQPEKAIEDLDQAIALNPGSGVAYSSRALAYAQLGLDLQAEEDLEQAVIRGVDRSTLRAEIDRVIDSR